MLFLYFLLFPVGIWAANDAACGTKGPLPPSVSHDSLPRIISGEETMPHEYPWMCQLQTAGSGFPFCGGSILNSQWIITAGHCVGDDSLKPQNIMNSSDLTVLCGVHNWRNLTGNESRRSVETIIRHPKYWPDDKYVANDVALLKLTENLELENESLHLGSICIPDLEPLDQLAETECIATGWGRTSDDVYQTNGSDVLRKGNLKLWKQADCIKTLLASEPSEIANQTGGMLCGGDGTPTQACPFRGDSGGPLNCFDRRNGRWTNYGLTSYHIDDFCKNGFPEIFARVSTYSKWIWKTVAENSF